MNLKISENASIRTIETIINEAKALGMRVIHRPDQHVKKAIDINSETEKLRMQICQSAEA